MAAAGSIYILINPSIQGMLKIGKTTKSAEVRARELSTHTGLPTAFLVAYEVYVCDCDRAERDVHDRLKVFRVSDDREFFSAPLKRAIEVLEETAYVYPVDAPQWTCEDELLNVEFRGKLWESDELLDTAKSIERSDPSEAIARLALATQIGGGRKSVNLLISIGQRLHTSDVEKALDLIERYTTDDRFRPIVEDLFHRLGII